MRDRAGRMIIGPRVAINVCRELFADFDEAEHAPHLGWTESDRSAWSSFDRGRFVAVCSFGVRSPGPGGFPTVDCADGIRERIAVHREFVVDELGRAAEPIVTPYC